MYKDSGESQLDEMCLGQREGRHKVGMIDRTGTMDPTSGPRPLVVALDPRPLVVMSFIDLVPNP